MRRTMNGTLAEEIRWRVAMRLIIWGLKIAPAGDARGHLIDACASWAAEGRRQRERHATTEEN